MKRTVNKKILWGMLAAVAVIVIGLVIYVVDLTSFPGGIKETAYSGQAVTTGVKTTFHQGVIYRYPNVVPMLEVEGDYCEMGLQYGVLLRPEIKSGMASMTRILQWNADEMGLPYPLLVGIIKFQARQMAAGLPQKYQDEMRGVSEGSGVPYDTVISCSLFYDIGMGMDCTGVLMRGEGGSIIQGRNNDTAGFGGDELAKMTVVVRYKANGKNVVTHMDQPCYMGVETGYNDKGITFAEETLRIKTPNPGGYSLPYLIRMVLEDASTLDQIYPYFDKYHTIGGYGCVWGDLRAGRGVVVELTPTAWAKNELSDSLLYNFNRIYDSKLVEQQKASRTINNINIDRETVAGVFPIKKEYTIKDTADFVRAQVGPGGIDYAWCGTMIPVCNWMASQMMIFDSKSDGFYMSVGTYFAARQNIYHFYDDFSKQPELFLPALPVEPVVEKAAQIENRLISKTEKLQQFTDLANEYKDDANVQFIVAYKAFRLSKVEMFAEYAEKAYALKPSVAEYKLYAGFAAYQKKEMGKAITLIESVDARYPEQELLKLAVLEKAYAAKDPDKAVQYITMKQAVLEKYGAQSYYESKLLPLIDGLGK